MVPQNLKRISERDFNSGQWNGKFMGYISKLDNAVYHLNVRIGDKVTNKYRSGYWLIKQWR